MIHRSARALLPLILLSGCEERSTVGYNESGQPYVAGAECAVDTPLGRCESGTCVVSDVFDAPSGAISTAVDSESIFFIRSQQVLGKRSFESGAIEDLVPDVDQLMRMTVDETHLYWTELDGRIRAVPKVGGASFESAYVFGNPLALTLDSDNVYWVIPQFGEVAMAPKPVGEATQISGQASPEAIAVDSTYVYWVNNGTTDPASGQLVRALRGNLSSAEVIRSDLDAPILIALGSDAIYWASMHALYRMPTDGGDPIEIANGFEEIKDIAAYRDTVYGVGKEGLWRVPSSGGAPTVLEPRPMSALTLACSGVYASGWFEAAFVRYAP